MKTPFLTAVLFLVVVNLQGQNIAIDEVNAVAVSLPKASVYLIGERGPDYRVVLKLDTTTNDAGQIVSTTNQAYVDLATGMHFRTARGEWAETIERFDILPQGGAAATNGQHKVYLPSDIYSGVIEIITADGRHLQNRPLGISYFDGTNSVLIAELTNSVGQRLPSGNQVIYTNCFTDFQADLLCTYRKAGFEADLIFREQPPGPKQYGLDPGSSRLQLLTEFFDTAEPALRTSTLKSPEGLEDATLSFGSMRMHQGKAFSIGDTNSATPVFKSWMHLEGRTFLLEEVPYLRVKVPLQKLSAAMTPVKRVPGKVTHVASTRRQLPPLRVVQATSKAIQIAKVDLQRKSGVVLDYQIVSSTSNFVFKGDTTYSVTNWVDLAGTTTIEGGTVIKYGRSVEMSFDGPVNCLTDPYRPAIFTAIDDNSVGESLSTNTVSGYYGGGYFHTYDLPGSVPYVLSNIRMCYAMAGFDLESHLKLSNAQFVNCQWAIVVMSEAHLTVNNALFHRVGTLFSGDTLDVRGSHWTVHQCNDLGGSYSSTLSLTNSLLVELTNNWAGFSYTTNAVVLLSDDSGVFQSAAGGYHYLADNSPYRNAGANNLDSSFLADLRKKTTYPPIVCSNVTVTVNTTLKPQAARDTNTPDLGFHYDPLDYLVYGYIVTNSVLTITDGAAIGYYSAAGFWLQSGSSLISIGTPQAPNWITRYQSVQEQSLLLGSTSPVNAYTSPYGNGLPRPTMQCRFTKFTCPSGGGNHIYSLSYPWNLGNILIQDCELWGGKNSCGGDTNTTVLIKNNLFFRSLFNATGYGPSVSLSISNNTFFGVGSSGVQNRIIISPPAGSVWYAFNNSFDSCYIALGATCSNGYNAYINCTNRINPATAGDLILSNAFSYVSGPLGNFYQGSTNLLNEGNVTADVAGLYHYTVLTNLVSGLEIKETNSWVDLGYHYVAVNSSNQPIDGDSDGIPDYFEDVNGNGIYDNNDIADWSSSDTDSDGVNDFLEWLAGRNPKVAGANESTSVWLQVHTPLK
jgi:hypothetical protein